MLNSAWAQVLAAFITALGFIIPAFLVHRGRKLAQQNDLVEGGGSSTHDPEGEQHLRTRRLMAQHHREIMHRLNTIEDMVVESASSS